MNGPIHHRDLYRVVEHEQLEARRWADANRRGRLARRGAAEKAVALVERHRRIAAVAAPAVAVLTIVALVGLI